MLKRDIWDKFHRSEAAKRDDYVEEMRLAPRNPLPGQYHRGLAAKVEAKRQQQREEEIRKLTFAKAHGVVLCPGFSKWFRENSIDEARLQNAMRATLGQALRDPDPISEFARTVAGRFFRFNEQVSEIDSLFPGTMLKKLPDALTQWLLKFRQGESDRGPSKRAQKRAQHLGSKLSIRNGPAAASVGVADGMGPGVQPPNSPQGGICETGLLLS